MRRKVVVQETFRRVVTLRAGRFGWAKKAGRFSGVSIQAYGAKQLERARALMAEAMSARRVELAAEQMMKGPVYIVQPVPVPTSNEERIRLGLRPRTSCAVAPACVQHVSGEALTASEAPSEDLQ